MIMAGLPPEALEDCFRPPDEAVQVQCIHCGNEYSSDEIVWRPEPDLDIKGFWCCPIPGCDGKGFQFDIFPLDTEWEEFDDEDADYDEEDEDDEDDESAP